jgi:isopentenyl-diphosphate delta-isomerase
MISNNDVVLVNEKDEPLGTMEKMAAHKGEGKLHRAISVWIIRNKSQVTRNKIKNIREIEVLITKRSSKKFLWPNFWSNTVCSHPKEGESYKDAGERRAFEEVGIKTELGHLYTFEYKEKYKDTGSEHEMTGVLIGTYDGQIRPHPDEISDYRWVSWRELTRWSKREKEKFTPWFFMEMKELSKEKYKKYFR